MTKNWINFRFLHICPVEKCEISPNLAKFHISPHLLCGKTEIPLHVEKFHVLKSEISPHGRFFLHLHLGDRGDKYQVCFKPTAMPSFLGDAGLIKVVFVFGFGHSKSHFWAPQNGHFWHFQVPENATLSARIKKRRPLFHANTPPKWWTRYLFHVFTSKSDFWPFY